jgi:hypothetical protein
MVVIVMIFDRPFCGVLICFNVSKAIKNLYHPDGLMVEIPPITMVNLGMVDPIASLTL